MNMIKTTLLLGGLTALLVVAGQAFGGTTGVVIALGLAVAMNFGAWYGSDKLVIATSGAQPIYDPGTGELAIPSLRWLVDDVVELAGAADMPVPRIYLVPNERSPNAFATGRDPEHGVVAVTAGLLELLDRRQVKGVLAHELGHIKHRDTLISAVAATIVGAITSIASIARWGLIFGMGRDRDGGNPFGQLALILVAPIAATLVHLAVSRTREYAADQRAAELTGDPEGLAQALARLGAGSSRVPMHTGNEATHYIVNGFAGGMGRWMSTHPPLEDRIAKLRAMAR